MSRIRGKDTAPEMIVRRLLHAHGYRYRLHRSDLPGKPDIVFPVRKKAIFVHGCFWHGHNCKKGMHRPKSNQAFWAAKLDRNRERDAWNLEKLREAGWQTLTIWECQIPKPGEENLLVEVLASFLAS